MHAIFVLVPIILSVETISAQIQNQQELQKTISSIFDQDMGTPNIGAPVAFPTPTQIRTTKPPTGHSYQVCGVNKECVAPYLCSNGNITDDDVSVFDVRIDIDDPCPGLETCCSIGDKLERKPFQSSTVATNCGYRNPDGIDFKLKGNINDEAEFGEFPWILAIMSDENIDNIKFVVYRGGGSLIAPHVALTAAHCIQDLPLDSLTVRAGEWESSSEIEPYPHQDQKVEEIIIHEQYNKKNLQNDIALLFLEKPFDMAPNVNIVCLPPPGHNFDFAHCFVSGWGKDKFHKGEYVNILKKINVPALPHDDCQEKFRSTRLSKYFRFHSSFMCAGGELGRDACTGDGGAPLVCPISGQADRFYQAGIVAWGIGCGDLNVPGAYVSISNLRGWVDVQLGYKKVNRSFYTA